MSNIVLVPGAWLGGWSWQRVAPILRAAGHDVYTPTLTGLGERAHLASPDVGLNTHIQDITNVLFNEDLSDVTLVGHSYGGFVVSGVAARAAARISRLIYAAAVVPTGEGDSLFVQAGPQYRDFVQAQAQASGDGWRWPLPTFQEIQENASDHGLSEADQAWFRAKAIEQPTKTFADPIELNGFDLGSLPRSYIYCTGDKVPLPAEVKKSGWENRELVTGHWPMFTQPSELASLILELMQ